MRRRSFLTQLTSAGLFGLGAGRALAIDGSAGARARRHVRLGSVGNACEAVTLLAPQSAIFAGYRLAAHVVPFGSESDLLAALDRGSIDAASMKLPSLLEPLQSGRRMRVVAGLHAGCMRVLARDVFAVNTPADLKGTVIATDRLKGPAMNLLAALLRRQGLDPQRDITWRAYARPQVEAALAAKTVNCVAVSDPVGYVLLTDHQAEPYLDTAGGGFSCGNDVATGHHCFLALHSGLIDSDPAAAAALTRAYLAATTAVGDGVGPAAVAEMNGPFHADIHATLGMLSSYDWTPSTDFVVEELELTARDFRRAGLLHSSTDPMTFATAAFADVLRG